MSIFIKKKEEVKETPCCCGEPVEAAAPSCCCGGTTKEPCCEGADKGVCCVKVLGSNCKSCHALLESAQTAVKTLDLGLEVEYVTDMEKVMAYGVMSLPALVINDQVVSMGKVLKPADVEKLLHKFGV